MNFKALEYFQSRDIRRNNKKLRILQRYRKHTKEVSRSTYTHVTREILVIDKILSEYIEK